MTYNITYNQQYNCLNEEETNCTIMRAYKAAVRILLR